MAGRRQASSLLEGTAYKHLCYMNLSSTAFDPQECFLLLTSPAGKDTYRGTSRDRRNQIEFSSFSSSFDIYWSAYLLLSYRDYSIQYIIRIPECLSLRGNWATSSPQNTCTYTTRVSKCLSPRPNCDPPHPLSRKRLCPPRLI